MKPVITNAKQIVLLTIILVIFQMSVSLGQTCNNWLSTPTNPSYVNAGQINVSGNQVTVEATFNRTTPYVGGPLYAGDLVSKHNTTLDVNYLLRPSSAEITTTNGYFRTPPVCDIKLNKTYHAAMVYDGTTLKFYRDGYLLSQIPATGDLVQNTWQTRIGWYEPQGFNTNFIGYTNEVKIWNVVRTQAQIRANMATPLPNPTTQVGLQAYYTFDNLLNKQGNTLLNGTLGGSATINEVNTNCDFIADSCSVSDITCDSWLYNPAVNSSISVGDLDVTGNTITVEALINRTQPYLPGGANNTEGDVVSKHNTFSDVNYLLRPNHAYITTTNGFFATPDICDIQLNKTYHVALVYNGSTLKFYRDGILLSQVTATGNLIQNNWKTRIGLYEPAAFTTQFLGYTNEVRIWNVARTQAQIRTYMTSTLPTPASQSGLLGYYRFDNLLNKQGNSTYDGSVVGSASINQTNPNCALSVDSCNVVVPVTITSFTTKAVNNNHITANWHTEEEYGIEKYLVQRSASGDGGFITIGSVSAITARRNNNYTFTDNTAKPNTNYFYRLKIVENNGSVKYSEVRQEKLSTLSLFTSVYPNPASNNPTLAIRNYNGKADLTIFNNLGQAVYTRKMVVSNAADVEVKLNGQAKGTYWLQLNTDNEIVTKKIIRL